MSGGNEGAYRGRFAPSPSGWLHLGNARTALVAWLRARAEGGAFVLRIEDIDGPRTKEDAVLGNLEELRWLGLDWDEGPDVGGRNGPYRQSQREASYAAALARLEAAGLVRDCYLARSDLRSASSAPHGRPAPYGVRQRQLNERVREARRSQGKRPSLRFLTPPGTVRFEDVLAGPQEGVFDRDIQDVVLRRADGLWSYALAVVADDAAMGITEVVRGDDLLPATFAQVHLHRALGHEPPGFLHVPLLLDEHGERMAKRRGSLTLHALRAAGADPRRVVGWLAQGLGLQPRAEPRSPTALVPSFALDGLRREAVRLRVEDEAFLLDVDQP